MLRPAKARTGNSMLQGRAALSVEGKMIYIFTSLGKETRSPTIC